MLCMSILSNFILELLGKIIGFISHTVPLQGLIIAKKDEKKHILNATNLTVIATTDKSPRDCYDSRTSDCYDSSYGS